MGHPQTNVNSLANLKMPKKKKGGHGYRYTLPREKIDEIFSHIANGLGLKKAAAEAGVSFPTVKKYFKVGDPTRGIQPLQLRLAIFQERISEKMNVLMEEQVGKRLSFVRTLIDKFEERLNNDEDNGIPDKISVKDIERLIKLEAFLCGGIKTQETEQRLLTADEIAGEA